MLAVRLSENLEHSLNTYAHKINKTKTDIVKEALTLYLDQNKGQTPQTSYEMGKDLFGRFSSGRDDLSSTYKQTLKEKLHAKHAAR